MAGFLCSCCGQWHDELPLDIGFGAPDPVHEISDDERENRVELNDDFCIMDNEFFFVRGVIEIPITDTEDSFAWGVWVSLSAESFKHATESLKSEEREMEPPYFGWLCNEIPHYSESTYALKTNVHTQPVGLRPKIELEPTDHPLAVEQRSGITIQRVQSIIETMLHGDS